MKDKLTLENQKRNLQSLIAELEGIKRKKVNLLNQEIILKKKLTQRQKALSVQLKEEGLLPRMSGVFLESRSLPLDEVTRLLLDYRVEPIQPW